MTTADTPMACEKCKSGTMASTKVRRFSPGLVAIGYTLWVPAFLLLLGVTTFSCFLSDSASATRREQWDRSKQTAIDKLQRIDELPPSVLADFKDDGAITPAVVQGLPLEQRRQVESITSTYTAEVAGAGIGDMAVTGIGGCGAIVTYFVCVPLLVLGLVLTLRKKVWRCQQCGYIFERS